MHLESVFNQGFLIADQEGSPGVFLMLNGEFIGMTDKKEFAKKLRAYMAATPEAKLEVHPSPLVRDLYWYQYLRRTGKFPDGSKPTGGLPRGSKAYSLLKTYLYEEALSHADVARDPEPTPTHGDGSVTYLELRGPQTPEAASVPSDAESGPTSA